MMNKVHNEHLPPLATSLASIVVLLAVISLSHQLVDTGYPTPIVPVSKKEYAIGTGYRTELTMSTGQLIGGSVDISEQLTDTNNSGWKDGTTLVNKGSASGETGRRQRLNELEAKPALDSTDAYDADDSLILSSPESGVVEADGEFSNAYKFSQLRSDEKRKTSQHDVSGDQQFGGYTFSLPAEMEKKVGASANTKPDQVLSFLDFYQADQQLIFQPAQGYWANTHIPGDPNIRLLKARLAEWDRSTLGHNLLLEQDVRPNLQPFDAPADNALSLSLMSDANAVEGGTRMRLQVGIRGIEHRRGQRPAMNMGVVIDLPADSDDSVRIAARALLDALLASKQTGDRFSLVVTGADNLVVPPADFRFGPLQLARQAIIGTETQVPNENRNLPEAIREVSALVRQTDDPGQPLGSSSILLISAGELGDVDALSAQIHTQARDGITLSVVALGGRAQNNQVEQLVLAGLGNRRILQAPEQARQLIEAELHSSSRAVARAVRLSIRLATGVHLIEVVGSERLGIERSQRVREIENSMDRRLSTNLGIQTDRGEDESGIQIVIPSIFSGDDVTLLLDVMVEGPGDIASVSLRYKDLVYLQNGSLQGHLSLPAGQLQRGPAEYAVLKNLMAHHFRVAAGRAANALGRHQAHKAVAILSEIREQIVNLRSSVVAFNQDPGLLRDEQILESYITLLAPSGAGANQPELADSLRYAAWAKVHRPLAEWK